MTKTETVKNIQRKAKEARVELDRLIETMIASSDDLNYMSMLIDKAERDIQDARRYLEECDEY